MKKALWLFAGIIVFPMFPVIMSFGNEKTWQIRVKNTWKAWKSAYWKFGK